MKRRRGSAAIELALSLPVLTSIFVGTLEMSRYISAYHMVARAARDGTRVGSITIEGPDATGEEIVAAAEAQALSVLEAEGRTCEGECSIDAEWVQDTDYFVTVTVKYPYDSLTHVFPIEDGVVAQFTMMTQQQ